jgi:hypothetical protein
MSIATPAIAMVIPAERFAVYQSSGLEYVLEVRTPYTGFGGTNCSIRGIARANNTAPPSAILVSKPMLCAPY